MNHYSGTLSSARYNHCSSVCPHKDGVLIAYYAGHRECHPTQATRIVYWDGERYSDTVKLADGTGNCVIWSLNDKEAVLAYSVFEKYLPERPVMQWMYCSNWLVKVSFADGGIVVGEPKELEIDPRIGCLARCQPIKVDEEWFLPMYREHDVHSIILTSRDGWSWEERGRLGVTEEKQTNRFGSGVLIQSTLWHDGKRFHSLSRDVTRSGKAWYSYSDDKAKSWSKPESAKLSNINNSIVALQDGTEFPLIVWNPSPYRQTARKWISLGRLIRDPVDGCLTAISAIWSLNTLKEDGKNSASYPNYCYERDNVHIVHSEYPVIRHHVFNKDKLYKMVKEVEDEETSTSEEEV